MFSPELVKKCVFDLHEYDKYNSNKGYTQQAPKTPSKSRKQTAVNWQTEQYVAPYDDSYGYDQFRGPSQKKGSFRGKGRGQPQKPKGNPPAGDKGGRGRGGDKRGGRGGPRPYTY